MIYVNQCRIRPSIADFEDYTGVEFGAAVARPQNWCRTVAVLQAIQVNFMEITAG